MQAFLRYFGAVMFVCGVGVLAWYLSGTANEDGSRDKEKDVIEWRSQVIGWMSAVLYRECSARLYAFLFLIPKPILFYTSRMSTYRSYQISNLYYLADRRNAVIFMELEPLCGTEWGGYELYVLYGYRWNVHGSLALPDPSPISFAPPDHCALRVIFNACSPPTVGSRIPQIRTASPSPQNQILPDYQTPLLSLSLLEQSRTPKRAVRAFRWHCSCSRSQGT